MYIVELKTGQFVVIQSAEFEKPLVDYEEIASFEDATSAANFIRAKYTSMGMDAGEEG